MTENEDRLDGRMKFIDLDGIRAMLEKLPTSGISGERQVAYRIRLEEALAKGDGLTIIIVDDE